MATVLNTRDIILRVAVPRYTSGTNYQTQIDAINSTLTSIASDTLITEAERQALRKEWDIIIAEYVNNSTSGLAYLDNLYPAVATFYTNAGLTGYKDRLQTLATYLNSGTAYTLPALGSAPTDAPNWISNANLTNPVAQSIIATNFRINWKNFYDAKTVLVNKAAEEAGKVAAWTGVTSRPLTFRVVTVGYTAYLDGTPSYPTSASIGLSNGETGVGIQGIVGSAYHIIKINRTTGISVFVGYYNILNGIANAYHGAGIAAAQIAMVSALNAIGSDHIVVIFTWDEPQSNRTGNGLDIAMYRCGASRGVFGSPKFAYRSAYVLVGIGGCGEGNGFEAYQGNMDTYPDPAGDPDAWVDVSFSLQNGNLIVTGAGSTPRTLRDYAYTGDSNATYGATWSSNLSGQPSDSAVLNTYVPTGINLIYNSAFEAGTDGWNSNSNLTGAYWGVNGYSPSWRLAPAGAPWTSCAAISQNGTDANGTHYMEVTSQNIPVTGGKRYLLSAYVGAARCSAILFIRVYNKDFTLIGDGQGWATLTNQYDTDASAGRNLKGYTRISCTIDMTEGNATAAYVQVAMRKTNTTSSTDSYVFYTRLQFEEVTSNVTEPSAWSDGARQHVINSSNNLSYMAAGAVSQANTVLYSGSSFTVSSSVSSQEYRDGPTFNTTTGSRIFASVTGMININVASITYQPFLWSRYILQLINVSTGAVADASGYFGGNTACHWQNGVSCDTSIFCSGSLVFDSVPAGTYKIRLYIDLLLQYTGNGLSYFLNTANFSGEISGMELKV